MAAKKNKKHAPIKREKPERNFFLHVNGICESTQVGEGTRIWAHAHVLPNAKIGKNCNVGEGVYIENEVTIGNNCTIKNGVSIWDCVTLEDYVFVGPNAVFTNDMKPRTFLKKGLSGFLPTLVKKGATIGANATILCGVTIGEFSLIGAGAVVTKDVPPHCLVAGNPAVAIGKICFCGGRLNKDNYCTQCECSLANNSYQKL